MRNGAALFFSTLNCTLSKRCKKMLLIVILAMVLASIAEVLSIGAVVPFLAVISNPDTLSNYRLGNYLIDRMDGNVDSIVLVISSIFIGTAIVAGAVRILLIRLSTKFLFGAGSEISVAIYRNTLYQPYIFHVSTNSSEIVSGITNKVNTLIYDTLSPILLMLSATMMMTFVLGAMIVINPAITFCSIFVFGFIYLCVAKFVKKRVNENSTTIAKLSTKLVKVLQESLRGIRDILIDNNQDKYCKEYQRIDAELREAYGNNQFISQSPRFGIEAVGMVAIAIFSLYLTNGRGGISSAIPVLGALAIAAQRMLPLLQQLYSSWALINGAKDQCYDVLRLLSNDTSKNKGNVTQNNVEPFNQIHFENVCYSWGDKIVLNDLSLKVKKGEVIGIVGASGSGKSTFLDIFMGLIEPDSGSIHLNQSLLSNGNVVNWQSVISHVPQSIFLADSSVIDNIAFGVHSESINIDKVKQAITLARLDGFINGLVDGYDTNIGEMGVRLSGGQRQRIGIARALYKQSKILILDEATSALDDETESEVMQSVYGMTDMTVIIVAHRKSTLSMCDRVLKMVDGKLCEIGKYEI